MGAMGNELDLLIRRNLGLFPFVGLGATGADDDDEDDEDEEEEEDPKPKAGDDQVKTLRAEAKRRRLEAKAERDARVKAEARLKELEDKEKTDLERSTTERDELTKRVAEMEPALQEAQRKLAFFESGVAGKFQNPAHALKLMDLKDIDLDDDGDAVASAIGEKAEALLKESPYLKAAAGGSNGETEGNGDGKGEPAPNTTGAGQSRGKPGKNQPPDSAALVKRFPALAGRIDTTTQQQQ